MKMLGIFGTSGFAREVSDIAKELGFQVLFIAKGEAERNAWAGTDDVVLEADIFKYKDLVFSIGVGANLIRQKIALSFGKELRFANLVHPSATFGTGQRAALDAKTGVIVCAGARFTNNIDIGNFSVFYLNATVGHDVIVDDFVYIAANASISGNVHIGERCWIGTGAVVNQGNPERKLQIGADTVIGSGSVVLRDCAANSVYIGVPAKQLNKDR